MNTLSNRYLIFFFIISLFLFSCERTPSQQTLKQFSEVLETIQEYEYGESRSWLQQYHDVLAEIYNDPGIQKDAESMMIKILDSKASHSSKLLICKSIGTIGGEASLPVLQKLLLDQETSNMAIIALTPIQHNKVDEILISSLTALKGEPLIGAINLLALRKTDAAIEPISEFINDDHIAISNAAINALGAIGGEKAIQILFKEFQARQEPVLAEALIKSLGSGAYKEDQAIYQSIYDANPSMSLKTAAFQGLQRNQPEDLQVKYLLKTLKSSDPEFQESLISSVRNLPEEASMEEIIDALAGFEQPFQQNLMLAIADRKDEGVRPFAIRMLSDKNIDHRLAALKALRSVSTSQDIVLLAGVAAKSSGKEQELARESIYWMDEPETDQMIVSLAKSGNQQIKAELLKAMGYRKIEVASDYVIDQIDNQNVSVRLAAIETAGMIAAKDQLNTVIEHALKNVLSKDELEAVIESLSRISINSNELDYCVKEIYQSLKTNSNTSSLIILTTTLGNIQTDLSFEHLKTFLKYDDPEIQFSCLKAFSNWSDDRPLTNLEEYLKTGQNPKNRQMAQVGVVNLVQRSETLSSDEKAEKLRDSFQGAQSAQEKVILLNGISRIYALQAMDFVVSQLHNSEVSATAQEAFIRIADNLKYSYEAEIIQKIDSIAQSETDDGFKNRLNILKRSIEL